MKKTQYTLRGKNLFRGGLRIFVNRIEENFFDSGLHEHDFIELNYVAEGTGYQYIGEQALPAARGDLFVLPVGCSHVFRPYSADKRSRLVVYNVVFAPSLLTEIAITAPELLLDQIVAGLIEDKMEAGIARDKRLVLEPLFERIHEEHAALRPGASAMLTALLTQILIEWTRLREKATGAGSPAAAFLDFGEAVAYVREQALEPLTQRQAAERFGLSERHFQRLFVRHTGQTFHTFVQRQRVLTACQLLRDTRLKLDAVSGMVGYRDTQSFTGVFKRIEGVTPGQYRKRLAGEL
ncbi:helix-turn-helix domain-containing protein [Cohnella sp. GbtcB17]|uniref:AraC family transcriptional regulator n=1 Tax=Cohnella sp. GbtcB17 TaxID=2824762 RepID=UPI001C31184E|nr:helix-turn-helix domain-containing protein [Cohnella sp. GbtcB17]